MSTAKARYTGDSHCTMTKDFSSDLKAELRRYFPDLPTGVGPTSGGPADVFVALVLSEARWAISELVWYKQELTKQEIRAEQQDLLKHLKLTHDRLKRLSPDLNRLLSCDADPVSCADVIRSFIEHLDDTGPRIGQLPTRRKLAEKKHGVAIGIATRVLSVLPKFGISNAATYNVDLEYVSDAVRILKAIGDDIDLPFSETTWRDLIMEAKSANPAQARNDEPWLGARKVMHSFGSRGDRPQLDDVDDVVS